jgi:hypothetical protein
MLTLVKSVLVALYSVVVNKKLTPNVYENIVHICNSFTKYFENGENGPIGIR